MSTEVKLCRLAVLYYLFTNTCLTNDSQCLWAVLELSACLDCTFALWSAICYESQVTTSVDRKLGQAVVCAPIGTKMATIIKPQGISLVPLFGKLLVARPAYGIGLQEGEAVP